MSRYSKIERSMWGDAKFRALSKPQPNARDLWIFLLTGPHNTNIPGLFVLGEAAMAEALEWPLPATRKCLAEIENKSMARVDRSVRLVWLPNALRHNFPENPNVVSGWRHVWPELPECPLKDEAREAIRGTLGAKSSFLEGFQIALGELQPKPSPNPSGRRKDGELPHSLPKGSPKPLVDPSPKGSPNQEQEQEQEQDHPSGGSEPSPRAPGASAPTDQEPAQGAAKPDPTPAPKASARKPARPRPAAVDPIPLAGTLAHRVYDAITRDPILAGITVGPGDYADRVTREGAYPRVDVLAQVLRAGEYAARFPGKYSDGRRFLARWLQTAADDAASRPSAVPAEPVSDEPVYEDWTGRGHKAANAPATAPGGVVRAILASAPTEMAPEAKAARIALLRAQLEEVKAAGGTGES